MPNIQASYFDWSFFSGALQLLQIVNKITQKLSSFDRTLRTSLVESKEQILSNGRIRFSFLSRVSHLSPTAIPCLHLLSDREKATRLLEFLHRLGDGTLESVSHSSGLQTVTFSCSVVGFLCLFRTQFSFRHCLLVHPGKISRFANHGGFLSLHLRLDLASRDREISSESSNLQFGSFQTDYTNWRTSSEPSLSHGALPR